MFETVSVLLAKSRAAHQRFQIAAGHNDGRTIKQPNDEAAAQAVLEALSARTAAEVMDPRHTDPAWAEDQTANKGVASAALVNFFTDYFASDVPL